MKTHRPLPPYISGYLSLSLARRFRGIMGDGSGYLEWRINLASGSRMAVRLLANPRRFAGRCIKRDLYFLE